MKNLLAIAGAFAMVSFMPPAAHAASCADLWYARNLVYAKAGYCFKTSLAQRQFAEFECWTDSPRLSAAQQRKVAKIRAEEKRRGCKVN